MGLEERGVSFTPQVSRFTSLQLKICLYLFGVTNKNVYSHLKGPINCNYQPASKEISKKRPPSKVKLSYFLLQLASYDLGFAQNNSYRVGTACSPTTTWKTIHQSKSILKICRSALGLNRIGFEFKSTL